MAETLTLDKARTAVVIMDYQNDIVGMVPPEQQGPLLQSARQVLDRSRQAGVPVFYVVVRFRDGYPEVSPRNKTFSGISQSGRMREGTPGAEIHSEVAPQPGEVVVTKRRVGAFSTTDLSTLLRARDIDTVVLMGIVTSGCVLSTVRWAADADYGVVVLSDGCGDRDDEVHRLLMEKVFPRQATVVTAQEFIDAL
ncbi:MAG: cysteine hydrolase [Dehalococcoidia bacterium]|nr:cysteine hydrolase [Dehalococcoidia bacterium]